MSFLQFIPRPGNETSIFDLAHLNSLKRGVQQDPAGPDEKQKEIAHQFEALFIQQVLKQARQAAGANGLLDSDQTRMTQSMADEQLALQLASPGVGLAQALLDQIQAAQGGARKAGDVKTNVAEAASSRRPELRSRIGPERQVVASSISALIGLLTGNSVAGAMVSAIKGAPRHIQSFVAKMSDAASVASAESGVPAKLILSQAALESGWGKREIHGHDGQPSFNLFGIKASPNWKGKVVNVMTTEYENGVAQKVMQPFRAYDSYAESFSDYARLVGRSERYRDVVGAPTAEEAAYRIQAAGYATDPAYADKLISIMSYFDAGSV